MKLNHIAKKSCTGAAARRLGGFTLVELLIAMLILTSVFTGFYLCLSQGITTAEVSQENLRATELIGQQMEVIRLYTWSEINSNAFIQTNFTAPFNALGSHASNGPVYTAAISITNAPMTESYSNNHVMVTVTLSWTSSNGGTHQRQMSTIVSQYGLHNYYY